VFRKRLCYVLPIFIVALARRAVLFSLARQPFFLDRTDMKRLFAFLVLF